MVTTGIHPWLNSTARSVTPPPASRSNSSRPSHFPGSQASRIAPTATARVSVSSILRSWRGVAPIARSSASSRLRRAAARVIVPAVTNSETITAVPPKTPETAIRSSRCATASGCSARPRSSPVRTVTGVPTAEASAPLSRAASVPGFATTAKAPTVPGWPPSRAASAGAKNSAGSGDVSRAAAMPLTRYLAAPPCAATVTVSPTAAPARAAVPASRTTSRGPAGARPPSSVYGARKRNPSRDPRPASVPDRAHRVASSGT